MIYSEKLACPDCNLSYEELSPRIFSFNAPYGACEKCGGIGVDFKIDPDDRKAILLINAKNPKNENIEEVIIHEILHLKLYPLDQLTEGLIDGHYNVDTPEYTTVYTQFMTMLEQTVEELTKCFLLQYGENKELSYGRCKTMKSFNELYDGLKPLK